MWIVFSILSCLFAAIMQIFNKKILSDIDPLVVTFIKNFIVFLFSIILLFFSNTANKIRSLSFQNIFLIIILSLITFLAYLFFYFSLKKGELNKVMAIDRFSIVLVFFFLLVSGEERLCIYNLIGVVLVFIGILFIMIRA